MNKNELAAEMKRNELTYKKLAKFLNISENTFWRKMNSMNDFTLPEIQTIVHKLKLNDTKIKAIFFN